MEALHLGQELMKNLRKHTGLKRCFSFVGCGALQVRAITSGIERQSKVYELHVNSYLFMSF